MKKKSLYQEAAYAIGMLTLAMGAALMARADFGVSMVVAPAYVLYLKLSQTLTWFTFGMAEYTTQAILLVAMGLVMRTFRVGYLFSFVTAFVYGLLLDGCMALTAALDGSGMAMRFVMYILGLLLSSLGVANMFKTYVAPEVYELFVKEVSAQYKKDIGKFKTAYDCVSCVLAIVLSFVFFGLGRFEGVKWGTIVCALINGSIIGFIGKAMDKQFTYPRLLKK